VNAFVPEDIAEAAVDKKIAEFRSCPACRGSGLLEITCLLCTGRGSVDPTMVKDRTDIIIEAAHVAAMPTNGFNAIRGQAEREQTHMILQFIRQHARNAGATQDYVGEHRMNRIADLIEGQFLNDSEKEQKAHG